MTELTTIELTQLRDKISAALAMSITISRLENHLNDMSKMVAALILQHGGVVSAENWEKANAVEGFLPYNIAPTLEGIEITNRFQAL